MDVSIDFLPNTKFPSWYAKKNSGGIVMGLVINTNATEIAILALKNRAEVAANTD